MIWDAANHSWHGYVRHAWGKDELGPIYNNSADTFGGLGATVVDSLDTLWLMGMAEEFRRARDFVAELNFDKCALSTTIQSFYCSQCCDCAFASVPSADLQHQSLACQCAWMLVKAWQMQQQRYIMARLVEAH